ncbi:MAG: LysM domain-containing protein [Caldilineaceae bacterium]
MRDGGVIHPGDTMLVPAGIKMEISDQGKFYVVQDGDSWLKIANEFELPLTLLQLINPEMMRPNFILKPGDEIFIPSNVAMGL